MKKIFTLFMMLLLLPCVMSAVENAIYVGGEELIGTDSSPVYAKTVNGAVITDGASENDYHVKWNGSVLTLNGVNIQGNDHEDAAIFYENGDLDIELVGENTVIGVDKNKSGMVFSYGIRTTAGNIKIRGTGSLQVKGGNVEAQYGNAYSYGINASGSIEVSAGSVISEGGSSSFVSTGIYAIENVQISGGVIRAIGADALTQSYGIWTSNGGVSISGGEVTAMSGNVENIESKSYGILTSDGGVSISGGEVTAMSGKGTGSNSMTAGIYAIGNVQILGGVIRAIGANAHTQSYGILTSNGGVSISGGEVTAMSGNVESTKSDSESSGVRAKTNISIVPQDGKVIAVKVGESEENVAEIPGSPFSEETELTEINDKCFYSKENDHLHRYGDTTYEWSDDYTTCTATRTCQDDASHTETATATRVMAEQTQAPTCTEKGETTYTATFSVDWAEEQAKTVMDIPALGHNWGETVYTWSEDNTTCTATRVCKNDDEYSEAVTVTVTSEPTKAPTCTEKGETTYTATFNVYWAEMQTKTVVIDATGHNWGEPVYTWSEDNTACTAKRVCQHDSEHSQTATATVTSKQTKAPACTEKGEMTYTATFSVDVDWAEKQTKTEDIPATGHGETEIQNAKEVTCTVDGYTGDEVCTVCGEVVTAGEIIPATGHHYVNGYCTECGHRDPDYRPDPISYYNIYVEDVCDGVEVSTSKQVVREGGSITVYVEKDTANYTFDNFKVYYKRSYYGGWEELKEGTQPGEYPINNIWTHIYLKAEGAEEKEDPTGIESIEGVKVYTKDGSLYVQTPQREQVIIVSMSGAVVKNEEQIGLKQYHGLQLGIYIVRVGDRAYKLRLN